MTILEKKFPHHTSNNIPNLNHTLAQLMLHYAVDDKKLAKATGIARTNITRLRTNPKANPTAATLIPIARFFNITVGQLVGEEKLAIGDDKIFGTPQIIPVIDWNNIDYYLENSNYPTNLSAANSFVPSSYNISYNSFCLQVEAEADELIMRKSSLVIIDPQKQFNHLNIVLAKIFDKPQFVKIIIENQKLFFKHLSTKSNEIHEFNNCIHKIIGTLVEIKYIF